MARKENALYFNELATIRDRDVVLGGHLYSLEFEDDPFTRLMICRDGAKWNRLGDIDGIVTSIVAYTNESGKAVAIGLCRHGELLFIESTGPRMEAFSPDPGFLFQLCRADDMLFACGSQRQVWRRKGGQWARIDAGIVVARSDEDNPVFYAIDGISERCLYAGGRSGELFRYDGRHWTRLDSPTNRDIQRIAVVSETEVYFCGKGGTFYRGHDNVWELIGDPGYQENFWGLARFQDRIFTASLNHLFAYGASGLQRIDPPPQEEFSYHRIAASPEYLWATGGAGTVARWNGADWALYLCPDNR